jgi:dUTP pyrophosphatase
MEPPTVLNNDEKPKFLCPDCDREFANMGAMKSHLKTHRDSRALHLPESTEDSILRDAINEATRIVNLPEFPKEDLEMLENPTNAFRVAKTQPIIVKVKKLPHGLDLPELKRGTAGAAAVDLYAAVDDVLWLGAQTQAIPPVPTGIAVEIPEGYVGKIAPRSGLAAKNGISIVNSPGIIDCDYRGEIKITLINHSPHKFPIRRGDRIAQMLIEKVEPVQFEYVDELSETIRGEGGFGSTGVSTEIKSAPPITLPPGKTVRFADIVEQSDGETIRKLPPDHHALLRDKP